MNKYAFDLGLNGTVEQIQDFRVNGAPEYWRENYTDFDLLAGIERRKDFTKQEKLAILNQLNQETPTKITNFYVGEKFLDFVLRQDESKNKCHGKTKKGLKCNNQAKVGSYCSIHQN